MQAESQAWLQADPTGASHRLPADDIIDYTLSKMQARLDGAADHSGQERNGLLFTGNIHDAYPRALILDMRLAPLDKMCWIMIRQYALQNDGAIFPSYDELQKLLSSPGSGLSSRDTVSRALTMLRLTGWLSLCKRVRDSRGRVRGNIYAQHDEPMSAKDAEVFDPGWLDMLGRACRHKYREVRETARRVLDGILDDPMMRHRHSRLTEIAERLTRPSTARDVVRVQLSPANGLSTGRTKNVQKNLSPESRLSSESGNETPSPDNRFSNKSCSYDRVRKADGNNVRSFTQKVINKTYVDDVGSTTTDGGPEDFVWPDGLQCLLPENEQAMLAGQLYYLYQKNSALAENVAVTVVSGVREGKINNPVAYLLTLLRQAREGRFRMPEGGGKSGIVQPALPSTAVSSPAQSRGLNERHGEPSSESFVLASKEVLTAKLAEVRAALQVNRR
ncbi:helix-turn-helix domain-containing protein [Salmonella enterica]|nr:helix-turn-helix domain-containing protein [Salmonella enterica]EJN1670223.1 helix-turn-helix domain-containing protein [Salmonella enterica]